ncbi:MAG: hypothetical protein VX569_12705 [Pseudomonadota bacterium]|nr:hypothetical protein [Pseudomonadota bacterium]
MGFISLKSHSKFRGLINVSGFHVDPGFNGRLIYSVFNAGPSAIPLTRGDKIFLLWVADLAGRTDDPKYRKTKPGYADIPSSLIANVSKENHSLQALSEQINEVAEQFRVMKRVGLGVATAIGVILAAAALWPDEKDPPAQQIIKVPYEARGTATSPALPPPSPTPTAAPS